MKFNKGCAGNCYECTSLENCTRCFPGLEGPLCERK